MQRKFSEEFKLGAVKLVIENGVSGEQAAKDLGIGYSTLQSWISRHRAEQRTASPVATQESDLVKQLRAENHKLKLERELLKKAAVFFATDRTS